MKKHLIVLVIVSLATLSCQTTGKTTALTTASEDRAITKGLTESHSLYRSKHISNVSYDLDIDLLDSSPRAHLNKPDEFSHYNGKLVIEFDLDEPAPLTLDFNNGEFKSIIANGNDVNVSDYNKIFLPLSTSVLQKGRNQLILVFRTAFSNNGAGLYKFFDKEDGNIYLYTHFEPFDANTMFPCFDQPDLKATFKIKVRAPLNWQVISSTREEKVYPTSDSKTWVFAKTAKISPYVFSLHAGPYSLWESQYKGANIIPLRLFARKSLAKYIHQDEWFSYTQSSLKYFENYFGYAYPFKKYDQIVVPNFNAGAMENVAAITFSESFIRRGKTTEQDRERLANTLLHEMAHMWFGDLVTMKWWNDLWLNESFATFMATKAVASLGRFKSPWQSFYSSKKWAYWTDQLVTTHPIEDDVPSTEEAFTNFDGITYGKGAASLKQLVFLIGEKSFQEGVKTYFKNYAFANTRRSDFTSTLAVAAQTDLHNWSNEWLRTKSLNSIQAHYTCSNNKIDSFELAQTAPSDYPTLRTHKTIVALFKNNGETISVAKTQEVKVSGASTQVKDLLGQECPYLVYPNYDDHAYFKVILDKVTLENLPKSLAKIPDVITRTMLWDNLWNMVRDAQISLTDYANIALENAALETDDKNFDAIISSLSRGWESVQYYLPTTQNFEAQRSELDSRIEMTIWKLLINAKPGSDRQKKLISHFISSVETQSGYEKLNDLISGNVKISGLNYDQDLRWGTLTKMSKFGKPNFQALVDVEALKDKSDWAQKNLLTIKASNPSASNKQLQFDGIVKADSKSALADLESIMGGLFPRRQTSMKLALSDQYFKLLPQLTKTKDSYFIDSFVGTFTPLDCSSDANKKVRSYMESHNQDLPYQVIKNMKVALQEDERCNKIQSVVLNSSSVSKVRP